MASNESLHDGRQIYGAVPAGVLSGAPTLIGGVLGVALIDRDGASSSTIDRAGVYNLSVKGVNDVGNVAVAPGDPIYYIDADTPKLSKKATGRFFGFALAAVNSGATATIQVLLLASGGLGQSDSGMHTLRVGTNGTTPVNVLGAATIAFGMKILGVFLTALDTTAGNITLAFTTAGSVVVIAKGTVAGVMVGAGALTNTVAAAGDVLTAVSSSAGNADVWVLYQIQP